MLDEVGLLRDDFHYIMDLELWYRLVEHGEYMERIPGYTWAMRIHDASKTTGRFAQNTEIYRRQEEKIQAERNHLVEMYPHRTLYQAPTWMKISYYLNKLFDRSVLSRFTDKKLLGQKVTDLFHP